MSEFISDNPCYGCRLQGTEHCEEQCPYNPEVTKTDNLAVIDETLELGEEVKPVEQPAEPLSVMDERVQNAVKNMEFASMRIGQIAKEMKEASENEMAVISNTTNI